MRNWNPPSYSSLYAFQPSFEPTYEELKLGRDCYSGPCTTVLSLPMRNWNTTQRHSCWWGSTKFWAYLWGIETNDRGTFAKDVRGFEPTYEELKRHLWQLQRYRPPCFEPTYEELKLSYSPPAQSRPNRFEPTYEELKRLYLTRPQILILSFEPTYEELKREYNLVAIYTGNCFEPTYEELKQ